MYKLICVLLIPAIVYAQSESIIHTKNGSVIRGQIIEYLPEQSITVRTSDGVDIILPFSSVKEISTSSSVQPKNRTPPVISNTISNIDPGIVAAASCIFPGLGQFLNEEPEKGVAYVILNFLCIGLIYAAGEDNAFGVDIDDDDHLAIFGFGGATVLWVSSIVDANRVAKQKRSITPIVSKKSVGGKVQFRF